MEQPLTFNDRRATIAVVAGLFALAIVGIVGGALFDDPCAELVTVGGRQTFVQGDPAVVFGSEGPSDQAEALLDYGRGAGLGPWRGAVAIDEATDVVGAGDAFLVFGPDGVDALEPGLSAVKANRSHEGRRVFQAFRGAAIGESGDAPYEVAVFDEDLALIGCGEVVTPGEVLAIDRVRAFHAEGPTLTAVGLDGATDWSRTFDAAIGEVELLLGAALVTTGSEVHLVALDDGTSVRPPWAVAGPDGAAAGPDGPATILDVEDGHALVRSADGLVRLDLRGGGAERLAADASRGAGILAGEVLAGTDLPPLPGELQLTGLATSGATYTALLAEAGDQRWIVLYGPSTPPRD